MDVAGLCEVCGKNGFGFSCTLCGKRVCSDCFTVRGVCRRCAGGYEMDLDKKLVGKVLREKGLDREL